MRKSRRVMNKFRDAVELHGRMLSCDLGAEALSGRSPEVAPFSRPLCKLQATPSQWDCKSQTLQANRT
jgi:hypothetical protein